MVKSQKVQTEDNKQFLIAQTYSLKLLSIRPRSEKELNDKLILKKIDQETIGRIIEKFKKINLINDRRFAKLWIDSRRNLKQKSTYVISQELKQKGIAQEIIDQELQGEPDSDLTAARKLLSKKLYRFEKLSGIKRKQKIQQFLSNKGFSWDVIKKVIKDE